jgi:hypothetical protein
MSSPSASSTPADIMENPLPYMHLANTVTMLSSLLCAIRWMYASPHHASASPKDSSLDKKYGTFCLFQLLGNFIVTFVDVGYLCTSQEGVHRVAYFTSGVATGGICIFLTNVLIHRFVPPSLSNPVSSLLFSLSLSLPPPPLLPAFSYTSSSS